MSDAQSASPANRYSTDELLEIFQMLGSWEERYRFIIDLGHQLPPLSEDEHNDQTRVDGCMSQVWLTTDVGEGSDPVLHFRGDSDAHIVKGLIGVLFTAFSGRRASEILATDVEGLFDQLGLGQHISMNRRNGFYAMVQRIKQQAALHRA